MVLGQISSDGPDLSGAIDTAGVGLVDWAIALAVVGGGIVVAIAVRRAAVGTLRKSSHGDSFAELLLGRLIAAIIMLVALVYALGVVGIQIAPLLGALGLGGIALALALQPTLQNLFAGLVLHAQRPLRVGEEVVTGGVRGTVTDITSRAVIITKNSGEVVYLPNSLVLDREIENLVRSRRRRSTVVVGVAYDTDLARAREVILAAASGADGVLDTTEPRVLARKFADSSVEFDVDFWHAPEEAMRRAAVDSVIRSVHRALGEAGIVIPFPQRTLWWGAPAPEGGHGD